MNKIDLNFGGEYYHLAKKQKLEQRIAKQYNLPLKNVQIMNGSNGSLQFLITVLSLRHWKKYKNKPTAIIDVPNYFDTIKFLTASDFLVKEIIRGSNFSFPLRNFISSIKKTKPELIIITTPNNPTGIPLSDQEIKTIIENSPLSSTILIDRTCLNIKKEISSKKILKTYKNKKIVILESFSKSHNMSADRISFLVTNNKNLADYFYTFYDDGRVNTGALKKLEKNINKKEIIEKNKKQLKKSLTILKNQAKQNRNFWYTPSCSNFCLVKIPKKIAIGLLKKYNFATGKKFGLKNKNIYRLNISDAEKVRKIFNDYTLLTKKYEK